MWSPELWGTKNDDIFNIFQTLYLGIKYLYRHEFVSNFINAAQQNRIVIENSLKEVTISVYEV